MLQSIAKRFSASAAGVLLARVMALVSVFGLNAILARRLSPEDFGKFILIFSLAGLASLFACVGLNRSIVKRIAEQKDLDRETAIRVVGFGLRVAFFGGCIVGTVAAVASLFLAESQTLGTPTRAFLFGAIIVVRSVHLLLAESARGFHERIWSNLFGGPAGGPVPHLLFVVLLLVFQQSSLLFVLSLYLASFVVTCPLLGWKVLQLANSRTVGAEEVTANAEMYSETAMLMSVGVPLMFTQTCGLAMSQADIWIAGCLAAPAAIAVYAAAQRMLGLLTISLQIASTAIVNFVPELAKSPNKQKLQQMVGLAANVGGIPGFALAIVFLIFAESILTIIFGEHYAQAALILRILTAGQIVCLLTGPCEITLMMAGQQKTTLKVNVVAALFIAVVGSFAVMNFGMVGLAVSIATVTSLQNIANWYLTHRLLGIWTHVGASSPIPAFQSFLHASTKKRSHV